MASPVRLSLLRKHTWFGGDRMVVGLFISVAVMFGWLLTNAYGYLIGIGVGATFWIGGTWVGRELYKADPYAFEIWRQQLKYRRFYAGRAHHAAEIPQVRDFIK